MEEYRILNGRFALDQDQVKVTGRSFDAKGLTAFGR